MSVVDLKSHDRCSQADPMLGTGKKRPPPRFCRSPETIGGEHLDTSQTCGFLKLWPRSFRNPPLPCRKSEFPGSKHLAQVSLCICLGACLPHQSRAWVASLVLSHSVSRPWTQMGPNPYLNLRCQTVSQTSPCLPSPRTTQPLLLPSTARSSSLILPASNPDQSLQVPPASLDLTAPPLFSPLFSLGLLPISSSLCTAHAPLVSLPGPIYLSRLVHPSSFRGYMCCVFGC